jgi:hypothetical protein
MVADGLLWRLMPLVLDDQSLSWCLMVLDGGTWADLAFDAARCGVAQHANDSSESRNRPKL